MTDGTWRDNIDLVRNDFYRDGAVVLRNAIPGDVLNMLAEVVDDISSPNKPASMAAGNIGREGEGRFFAAMFPYAEHPVVADFLRDSDLAEISSIIMKSNTVKFFFNHILIKEPGSSVKTPWHQDLPYWPVLGEQLLSMWIPFDHTTPENGVVTYVKGSHLWGQTFKPTLFIENTEGVENFFEAGNKAERRDSIEDINENPDKYEFISWDLAPGDILLHHPLCVHGAKGNSSSSTRRALATRWFGDDAHWNMERQELMKLPIIPDMAIPNAEDAFDSQFPILWPK